MVTESVELASSQRAVKFKKDYWHILVSLQKDDVKKIHHYIHLPDNKEFHRITWVRPTKSNSESCYFLIQTRKSPIDFEDIEDAIYKLLNRCGIVEGKEKLVICETIFDSYFSRSPENDLINLSEGNRIQVVKSVGDLSRNICVNQYTGVL